MALRQSVREVVADFADNTSTHGIKRIKESVSLVLKGLWSLLLCGALVLIIYQVFGLIMRYRGYPVNTKIELVRKNELVFPGVTFCNLNSVSYEKIKDDEILMNFLKGISVKYEVPLEEIDSKILADDLTNDQEIASVFENTREFNLLWTSMTDKQLAKVSLTKDEFIIKCMYKQDNCKHMIGTVRDKDYGLCYTFPNRSAYPTGKMADKAGPLFGLTLMLNINQNSYVPFVTPSAGVRVSIHDIAQEAAVYEDGFSIAPGFETSLAIKLSVITRLPHPYGNCKNSRKFLSLLACTRNCLESVIVQTCNCSRIKNYFGYGDILYKNEEEMEWEDEGDDGVQVCYTNDQFRCIRRVLKEQNDTKQDCSMCHPPCRENIFLKTMSLAKWPAERYSTLLGKEINTYLMESKKMISANETRDNLLKLKVYFTDLSEEKKKEEPAYELPNLLSDIGGQLGLWAGMSVLSICECFELLMYLVQMMIKKNRVKPRESNDGT